MSAAAVDASSGDHMSGGSGLPAGARVLTLPLPLPAGARLCEPPAAAPAGARAEFALDCGAALASLTLAYSTYGALNAAADNAVVVGHSLTSDSRVHAWWGPLLGAGARFLLDTERYFVVCANVLGSVYGSSGPRTAEPGGGGAPPGPAFPAASVRDNVRAQHALLRALGVRRVALAVGGSLGGMLALEWAATFPDDVAALVVVAACAAHSAWGVGLGAAGRAAIAADARWCGGAYPPHDPPLAGLAAARQLAMLSYRAPASIDAKFGRRRGAGAAAAAAAAGAGAGGDAEPPFEVQNYLAYQGDKFVRRFDALAYVRMTQLLDSHDIGRGRAPAGDGGGGEPAYLAVLRALPQRTLVVGIDSDILYPVRARARARKAAQRSGESPLLPPLQARRPTRSSVSPLKWPQPSREPRCTLCARRTATTASSSKSRSSTACAARGATAQSSRRRIAAKRDEGLEGGGWRSRRQEKKKLLTLKMVAAH
jgi:homoserine O-acetyltransferase